MLDTNELYMYPGRDVYGCYKPLPLNNTLITGSPGSGKSVLCAQLISSLITNQFESGVKFNVRNGHDDDFDVATWVSSLNVMCSRRYSELTNKGCKSYVEYSTQHFGKMPPLVVVVDGIRGLHTANIKDFKWSLRIARTVGVYVILVVDEDSLKEMSTELLNLFPNKAVMKSTEATSRMLLRTDVASVCDRCNFTAYIKSDYLGENAVPFKVPYCSESVAGVLIHSK